MNFFINDLLVELNKILPSAIKNLVLSALYLIGGYILIKILKKFIDRVTSSILTKENLKSKDFEARIKTISLILKKVVEVIVFLIVILTVLSQIGVAISPLLTGLGIVGVAVGFGAQYLIRDLISGFFLILEDQIRVGEFVKIDNLEGIVETINLRTTKLRALGGQVIIIPNGEIHIITNNSRDFIRAVVEVELPYDLDLEKAFALLEEAVSELKKEEDFKANLLEEVQIQGITSFGSSAVKYRILAKMTPQSQRIAMESKIRNEVFSVVRKHNLSIPFPKMDIHLYKKQD